MSTHREEARRRNDEKDARLIKRIREAGFNVDRDTCERFSTTKVSFEDRVVAVIARNTGSSSWYPTHEGWRVRCPHFVPAGSYNGRNRETDPDNPVYWGGRNYTKADSVIDKLIEAKNNLPDEQKIREGQQLQRVRNARQSVKSKSHDLAGLFANYDTDFIEYAVSFLPDPDDADESFRDKTIRCRAAVESLRNAKDRLESEYTKLENIRGGDA